MRIARLLDRGLGTCFSQAGAPVSGRLAALRTLSGPAPSKVCNFAIGAPKKALDLQSGSPNAGVQYPAGGYLLLGGRWGMNVIALSVAGFAYMVLVWWFAPRRVASSQFFDGKSDSGSEPAFWLLVASSAISWIFAKSIVNAGSLTYSFGLWGGFGYSLYYLSFIVVAVAVFWLRLRGGYRSLPDFLIRRYGVLCMRLFLIAVGIRLFNEVWSNTKVVGQFFGSEGSFGYWLAVILFTAFAAWYSVRGGLRGSLITDGVQMLLAVLLLVVVLSVLAPELSRAGLPIATADQVAGGMTFALLALTQIFSYGFHDPVMTDRAFITNPKRMILAFATAAAVGVAFISLFSLTGSFARASGSSYNEVIFVASGTVALPLLLVFSVLMLTSAGSTLDSTFSSTAKLMALDWKDGGRREADLTRKRSGQIAILLVAVALFWRQDRPGHHQGHDH